MSEVKAAASQPAPAKSFLTEKLPTFIAITTLLLAVCATFATFKAGGYGNKMVLAQTQSSDQWAYYQAKSIKETAYQVQRDTLAFVLPPPGSEAAYAKKLAEFDQEIARYKAEKKDIMTEAQKLEKERDKAAEFNGRFGQALIFLQVGILMSSLAAINKIAYYWYLAMLGGGVGVFLFFQTLMQTL